MLNKKLIIALFLILSGSKLFAGELVQVPAAIQISSKVSDGKYTIPQILSICRDQGFKAVVITDRDLMRWEYGIWPLWNILKKTVEDSSILKYGAKRYLREFKVLEKENPDLVVIPGVESAPFYYWQGDLFNSNLEIRDWHKHLIAIGVDSVKVLEHFPVIGNKKGLARPFRADDLFLFWPVLLLLTGILCLRKRAFDYKDENGQPLANYSKSWRRLGLVLLAAGLLFLAENFPFRTYLFDQYHGGAGIKPYQNYLDYANRNSVLSFWAHPEAGNVEKEGEVTIRTEEHSRDLLLSRDYTGFTVFYEGFKTIGKIGGIWDSLLKDYCAGKRNKPVWAIGALSFDSNGNLEDYLKDLRTVLLVETLNAESCLNALKTGRMYASLGRNSAKFILNNFSVSDSQTNIEKIMGQELNTLKIPRIRIKADFLNGQPQLFKIKLICDGKLIKTFEATSPLDVIYPDEQAPETGAFYYRLEIQGPDVLVVTNPIFVKKLKEK